MAATANTCAKCGRDDCPLLATSIIGMAEWFDAVGSCLRAQTERRIAERTSPHKRVAAPRGGR